MKNLNALCVLLLLCMISCESENLNNDFWTLNRSWVSDGATSYSEDKLTPVSVTETLLLKDNGDFEFINENEQCNGKYMVTEFENELDKLELSDFSGDCNFVRDFYYIMEWTDNRLLLAPQCIEGCVYEYVR